MVSPGLSRSSRRRSRMDFRVRVIPTERAMRASGGIYGEGVLKSTDRQPHRSLDSLTGLAHSG